MLHILLHDYNFDQGWAAETLRPLLAPETRVLIVPLADDDGWADEAMLFHDHYRERGDFSRTLARPFVRYGIPRSNITVINHHDEDPVSLMYKIHEADLVFLCGDEPQACLNCMRDLGLDDILMSFNGILMSASAAASVLGESAAVYEYDTDFYEVEGLGLLQGIDLDMEYREEPGHIAHMIRMLETRGRQVLVCPENGGILLDDGECALFGEAFLADENDLDELYELYRTHQ